jgi:osmoprotectant transport system substrate-binding protein/osmoprotectant transport system permease protein
MLPPASARVRGLGITGKSSARASPGTCRRGGLLSLSLLMVVISIGTAVAAERKPVVIGSKKFTESVILGDAIAGLLQASGVAARHRRELGGTRILWSALLAGEIDAYPEYTGTITREIFAGQGVSGMEAIRAALAHRGVRMTAPLGFDDTYAIGVRRDVAQSRGLKTISDLARNPGLRFGFSNEFMDRGDGWPGLRAYYGLSMKGVRGLDHDLAYRGIRAGDLDGTDVYTTDAEIAAYDLAVLADDRHYFPDYQAVILYRAALAQRAPEAVAAFRRFEGHIDTGRMRAMNAAVKLHGAMEQAVAAQFLKASFGITVSSGRAGLPQRLLHTTAEHLTLVAVSLLAAIVVALPLGILAARRPRLAQLVLGVAGVIQTIPSLALLVFMIPLFGIGTLPAIVALFLYSLLPIVRNTHAGLVDIEPSLRDAAEALGFPPAARLRLIELPMAARPILAGIKTSAVINVGTATLGALIGAGGYGQPILTGIRLDDTALILEGAIPAAVLALAVQGVFELSERLFVSRGLRL